MAVTGNDKNDLALCGGPAAVSLPAPGWPVVGEQEVTWMEEVVRSGNWSWLGPHERAFVSVSQRHIRQAFPGLAPDRTGTGGGSDRDASPGEGEAGGAGRADGLLAVDVVGVVSAGSGQHDQAAFVAWERLPLVGQ